MTDLKNSSDANDNVRYIRAYHQSPDIGHHECNRSECQINAEVVRKLHSPDRDASMLIASICFVMLAWLILIAVVVARM